MYFSFIPPSLIIFFTTNGPTTGSSYFLFSGELNSNGYYGMLFHHDMMLLTAFS